MLFALNMLLELLLVRAGHHAQVTVELSAYKYVTKYITMIDLHHPALTLHPLLPGVALLGVRLASDVHLVRILVGAGDVTVLAVESLAGQLLLVSLAINVRLPLLPVAKTAQLAHIAAVVARIRQLLRGRKLIVFRILQV